MDPEDYEFAVWGTQGGGLARQTDDGDFVFVEAPGSEQPDLKVGDPVPEEWDLAPANERAREVRRLA